MKKIAIIGTSPIVSFHIDALRQANLQPIAIASSNPQSKTIKDFAMKQKINSYFFDWKEMLREQIFDGILIASRIHDTVKILNESIKYDIPILVEKPVSFNSISLKKIDKSAHKKIMVGYNRRFYKPVNIVKKIVQEHKEPVLATMTTPEVPMLKNFFDNTSHSIDLLRFIFGDIKIEFTKTILVNNKPRGIIATLSTQKNDIVQFVGNWGASDNFSLITYVDKQKLELKPYEELNIFEGMDIIEPTVEFPIRKYLPKLKESVKLEPIDAKIKPGFFQQAKEFGKMIQTNSVSENVATLSDAQKVLELCETLVGKYSE